MCTNLTVYGRIYTRPMTWKCMVKAWKIVSTNDSQGRRNINASNQVGGIQIERQIQIRIIQRMIEVQLH